MTTKILPPSFCSVDSVTDLNHPKSDFLYASMICTLFASVHPSMLTLISNLNYSKDNPQDAFGVSIHAWLKQRCIDDCGVQIIEVAQSTDHELANELECR